MCDEAKKVWEEDHWVYYCECGRVFQNKEDWKLHTEGKNIPHEKSEGNWVIA